MLFFIGIHDGFCRDSSVLISARMFDNEHKIALSAMDGWIENAIWYGLAPKETGRTVKVDVSQNNGTVECIVDDDGIGRELSAQYKSQHGVIYQKGAGLTRSRLDLDKLLNERQDMITIIDKKDETGRADGTRVIITFKENRN